MGGESNKSLMTMETQDSMKHKPWAWLGLVTTHTTVTTTKPKS